MILISDQALTESSVKKLLNLKDPFSLRKLEEKLDKKFYKITYITGNIVCPGILANNSLNYWLENKILNLYSMESEK